MRVGVILAARAPVPYLAEALASVLSQQPPPDELVVVDHGSEPPLDPPPAARIVRVDDASGGRAAAAQAGLEAGGHGGALASSVARLAEAALAIHERHAALVDEATARAARARDLELLARGRIRERRYAEAGAALEEAASLRPPAARERALRTAVAIP